MKREEQNRMIENDLRELLKDMHNGESLVLTLKKIMEMFKGERYIEERKFLYMLQGLHMDKMGGLPDITEDKKVLEGFNEAAEQNNFAVKLAISAITGEEQ